MAVPHTAGSGLGGISSIVTEMPDWNARTEAGESCNLTGPAGMMYGLCRVTAGALRDPFTFFKRMPPEERAAIAHAR